MARNAAPSEDGREPASTATLAARASGLSGATAARLLERAVRFCAARLIQSAYEWGQDEEELSREAVSFLQLGINIFGKPSEACRSVVGIDPDGVEFAE